MNTKYIGFLITGLVLLIFSGCSTSLNKFKGNLNSSAINAENLSDTGETIVLRTLPGSVPVETYNLDEDEYANSEEPVSLETFKESLSDEGDWVKIDADDLDPQYLNEDENQYVNEIETGTESENQDVNVYVNVNIEDDSEFDDDLYTDYIWVPHISHRYDGWNPYCDGRWEWSYRGWVWVSNYSWGWAPYHYGRWWFSPIYGWVWSPGYAWAPSWVYWSHYEDYTGWHPISPRWKFHRHHGFTNERHRINNNGWVFVRNNDFTKYISKNTITGLDENRDFVKNSKPYINLNSSGQKIVNTGPKIKYADKNNDRDNELLRNSKVVKNTETENNTLNKTKDINGNKNLKDNGDKEKKNKEKIISPVRVEKGIISDKKGKNNTLTLGNDVITKNTEKKVSIPNSKNSELKNKPAYDKENDRNVTKNKEIKNTESLKSNRDNSLKTGRENTVKSSNSPKVKNSPGVETKKKENNSPKIINNPKVETRKKNENSPKINYSPKTETKKKDNNTAKINTPPKVETKKKIENSPKVNYTPKVETKKRDNNTTKMNTAPKVETKNKINNSSNNNNSVRNDNSTKKSNPPANNNTVKSNPPTGNNNTVKSNNSSINNTPKSNNSSNSSKSPGNNTQPLNNNKSGKDNSKSGKR